VKAGFGFTFCLVLLVGSVIWGENTAYAKRPIIATVTAEGVNIRAKPSAKSEVLAQLSKGAYFIVTAIDGSWAKIGYKGKIDKKYKSGWISTKFVRVVSGGGSETKYTTEYGAEFSLSVSSSDLDCSEGYNGGYDSCEVEINFDFSSNYNGFNDPTVNVTCDVELSTSDKSGSSSSESESDSTSVSGREGSGSMEVDVSVSSYSEPILSVELDDVSCSIDSVH
jgi:hypothetical protein